MPKYENGNSLGTPIGFLWISGGVKLLKYQLITPVQYVV